MIEMFEHKFVPDIEIVGELPAVVPMQDIIDEPMVWGADWAFTRQHGGPLTQAVLDQLETQRPLLDEIQARGRYVCIDTESQFLLLGQYPSIPGWHCDSIMEVDGRNDVSQQEVDCIHFMVSISDHEGGVSQTLFADETTTMKIDKDHVWQSVHQQAERLILHRRIIPDGKLVKFSMNTLHCPSACYQAGWRFWFRLSAYHKPPKNQLMYRTQVYTSVESRP